ncbi:uncharacterized protein [Watersipora subatra]|uniref:uncharacterized protein isoform X2 n=1 Tax=Watersipora subatra TaxID=2589382 RepID=UPI00355C9B3F
MEAQILGRIGPAHGFLQNGRSTPTNRPARPGSQADANSDVPRGAAAAPSPLGAASNDGTLTPHEKSFESEMADEGLDLSHMSQTRDVSLFAGPFLNYSEEETVLDTGKHLQEVVEMLLSRIEDMNQEIAEMKQEQDQLASQISQRNNNINELKRELAKAKSIKEELEEETEQLMQENRELRNLRSELFEQKKLNEELQTVGGRSEEQLASTQETLAALTEEVNELRAEREAVHQLKDHVEKQHKTLTNGANEAEKELLTMNSELEARVRDLEEHSAQSISQLSERVKELEAEKGRIDEQTVNELESLTAINADLQLQLDSLKRANQHDRDFIEQQTVEREAEREEASDLQKQLTAAQEQLKSKEGVIGTLQTKLEEAESAMHDSSNQLLGEDEASKSDAQLALADLNEKEDAICRMREMVGSLEEELQSSVRREQNLRVQLESFHGEQTVYNDPPSNTVSSTLVDDLSQRLEDALKSIQVLRAEKEDLYDQIHLLKAASEEYMGEKATLQSSVYEHMTVISNLRAQLEELKHQGSSKPAQLSHTEQLAERLNAANDALEKRDGEVEVLAQEINSLALELTTKSAKVEELEALLKAEKDETASLMKFTKEVRAAQNDLTSDFENLQSLAEARETQLSSITANVEALEEERTELLNEKESLMQRVIDLERQSKERQNVVDEKEEELYLLNEKLEALEKEGAASTHSYTEVSMQKEKLAETNKELAVEVGALRKQVSERDHQLSQAKEESGVERSQCDTLSESLDELSKTNQELTGEIGALRDLVAEREHQLQQAQKESKVIKNECYALREGLDKMSKSNQELAAEASAMQKIVAERDSQLHLAEEESGVARIRYDSLSESLDKMSKSNQELTVDVGALHELIAEKDQQLAQAKEECETVRKQCDALSERFEQLKASLNETDKYRQHYEDLAKQLSDMRASDELSKTEMDAMISEKISLAMQLAKERDESSFVAAKLANSEAERNESLMELDEVRAALLDTQAKLQELKAEHSQLLTVKESMSFTMDEHEKRHMADMESLQEAFAPQLNQLHIQLGRANDDRDTAMREASSLRDELNAAQQKLAASHDAEEVDARLTALQLELEAKTKDFEEDILEQKASYEEVITSLNEKIVQMRGEFEREYGRLKEEVVSQVSQRLCDTLDEGESFSESLKKDIEGRIAMITAVSHDSDQDTIADTSSQQSLDDEANVKDRQKHHLDQIEKESHSIYKLSHRAGSVGDSVLESVLQEKEILNGTIQSLKDLLSQVDECRADSQMNDGNPRDWRGALVQAVHQVFVHERQLYLQELRSFVAARGAAQPTEIARLESRLQSLTARQELSLDKLFEADRQSLLDEICEHRSLVNSMQNEIVQVLGQLEKQKAEAKQQGELMESKLLQQTALAEEGTLAKQQSVILAKEVKRVQEQRDALESALSVCQSELEQTKQTLCTEQNNSASLQLDMDDSGNQLTSERAKCAMLEKQLRQRRQEEERLRGSLRELEEKRHADAHEVQLSAQKLRQDLQMLRDANSEVQAKLDKELLMHEISKRHLVENEHAASDRERRLKNQIAEQAITLDTERARHLELSEELNNEKMELAQMREDNADLQRRPQVSEYKLICDQLDSEKSRSLDIQSALDIERNRSANLSAALDLAKAQAQEEMENERRRIAQLKSESKAKQRDLEELRSRLKLEMAAVQHERDVAQDAVDANGVLRQQLAVAEASLKDLEKKLQKLSEKKISQDSNDHSEQIYKKLRLIALRLKDASCNAQAELSDVFSELTVVNDALDSCRDSTSFSNPNESGRLLEFVEKLSSEKEELRQALALLEAEIQRYRLREGSPLSLHWRSVITDLYARARKAEARARGLVYQKKVLLLQLGGYEECEQEVMKKLTNMGAINTSSVLNVRPPPRRRFRAWVRAVIVTRRLRWLVTRSRKLVRDGVHHLLRNEPEAPTNETQEAPAASPAPSQPSASGSKASRSHRTARQSQPSSTIYGAGHRPDTSRGGRSPHPSVQSSRQSNRSFNSAGKKKSKVVSEDEQRLSSPGSSRSTTPHGASGGKERRSISSYTPTSSRTNSPSLHPSPSAPNSRRRSPFPRESQSSPALSGSYNHNRHRQCFPQEVYDKPVDRPICHDDSVVENINRLERLQERLSEMPKPT